MAHIHMLDTERNGQVQFQNFNLAAFARKTFGMYGGEDREVVLLCRREVAGVVLDRRMCGRNIKSIWQGC